VTTTRCVATGPPGRRSEAAPPPGRHKSLYEKSAILRFITDFPPFLTRQSHERSTLLRGAAVLVFHHFLACHSLVDRHKKTFYLLDTQVFFRVPPVCTPCNALEWTTNNYN
jgi:hypothetical protein